MRLNHRGKYFFLSFLFFIGCTTFKVSKPEAPPPAPPPQKKVYQEYWAEKAQKLRVRKDIADWEDRLNSVIDSLQAEIEENTSIIKGGLLPGGQTDIAKKNEVLSSVLEKLKQIKSLQQKLNEKDTALSRETIYLDLIDRYLSCLKLGEKTSKENFSYGVDTKEIEEKIATNYQDENYYKVIALYRQLVDTKPAEGRNDKIQAYYALSLARLGWEEDAIKVVDKAFQGEFSVSGEKVPLFYELGEWLIDKKDYEVAERIFQKIALYFQGEEEWYKKARRKTALFRRGRQDLIVRNKIDQSLDLFEKKGNFSGAYLLGLEAQKNCSDPDCQKEVQTFLDQLIDKGVADIEKKLRKIDKMIAESKFLEAQEMLSALRRSFSDEGGCPPSITEKLALVRQKEKLLQEREAEWKDEVLQQKLEQANNLLESESYEKAIILYDQLKGTPYQTEAEAKKQSAIDRLARLRRSKAGQLFFQAQHCENAELKKSYLIKSYNLLKSVMDEYPNNSYAEKIGKNLEDVRSEIEKIYPEFFWGQESSGTDLP